MWTARNEVKQASSRLGLSDTLRVLEDLAAGHVFSVVEQRFADRSNARWIWEHLRAPTAARHCPDGSALDLLSRLVPAEDRDQLYLLVGSDEDSRAVFQGPLESILAVLRDSPAIEYCIAPDHADWLLGENHHEVLFVAGATLSSKLHAL